MLAFSLRGQAKKNIHLMGYEKPLVTANGMNDIGSMVTGQPVIIIGNNG